MKRRDAIKMISVGMGYTLSAASLATLASSCKTEPPLTWTPTFFTTNQARAIEEMLEIMLPATDTPGAKEVDLAPLIDRILSDVYKKEDQEKFRTGMTAFFDKIGDDAALGKASTQEFADLLQEHWGDVSEQDQQTIEKLLSADPPPADAAERDRYYRYQFLRTLRSLAISGYFSSEIVATEHLNYMPVPGPYQGCIPLEDVGSNWAL